MENNDKEDIEKIESNLDSESLISYGRELCSIVVGFSCSDRYVNVSYAELGRIACATIEQRKRALINLGWLL